jgi:hypothetical protein
MVPHQVFLHVDDLGLGRLVLVPNERLGAGGRLVVRLDARLEAFDRELSARLRKLEFLRREEWRPDPVMNREVEEVNDVWCSEAREGVHGVCPAQWKGKKYRWGTVAGGE